VKYTAAAVRSNGGLSGPFPAFQPHADEAKAGTEPCENQRRHRHLAAVVILGKRRETKSGHRYADDEAKDGDHDRCAPVRSTILKRLRWGLVGHWRGRIT
jgi:hypothetical protein